MKKSLFTILLALLPMLASADAVKINSIYYNLNSTTKQAEVTSNPNYYKGKVTIPKTVTYQSVKYSVTSIGSGAFEDCGDLTSVTIPSSITTINSLAFFKCTSLSSLTIPNSVTSIGYSSFTGCSSLTSLIIPNSVTLIDSYAFSSCSGLTSLTIPNGITTISFGAFQNCSGLISVDIPNSVTSIKPYAFKGCSSLSSIVIPTGVTTIEANAFQNCSSLTSLIIPNSVVSIGSYAFDRCTGLTSVTIPTSVTSIGGYAFYGCSSLTSMTIPNSVTNLGKYVFCSCSGLTSVTIGNKVTSIGDYAFYGCSNLTSITIPNSVTSIGEWAFWACMKLSSVVIGSGVTSIGGSAFNDCIKLTEFHCFAKNVPETESNPFNGSITQNAILYVPKGSMDAYNEAAPWSGFKDIVGVTVKVALNKTKVTLEKGKTVTLKPTLSPTDLSDKRVTWKSSNTKVASVSSSGKVTGKKAGTATITCTSVVTGAKATCKVTIIINGTVTLNKTEAFIQKGKTVTLKATLTPTDLEDKSVTWTSSDTKIATVSSSGKVKGVKYGTATITCTSVATGATATCKVTVGKVIISMSEFTLKRSRTTVLTATVYPSSLTDKSVTWTSSDTKIATVTSEGKVKGIKAGTATITCTSVATGLSGTCTVTVLSTSGGRSVEGDDDDTTGIETIEAPAAIEPFDVYDLSGREVRHQVTSLDGLPDDIYIVNGKKMLKK